jgi:hypothetical protein
LACGKIIKVTYVSRPEDHEAVGYNVLLEYPTISNNINIVIGGTEKPSIQLIEYALLEASRRNIKHVLAFSRPAGFKSYLQELIGK